MAATGGLGGIGGPPPSSGAIGAVGTTSAGEGPGRPISGAADAGQGERTFSTEGGPQYGGRTPPAGQEGASDLGPFPGTTSAIGGMGADLEGGKGGKGFGVPGTAQPISLPYRTIHLLAARQQSEIEKTTGIPSKLQKLMCKGAALKDDGATLRVVLAKGVPEGGLPGIAGRQVRLTFKEELQQIWIGSDTSTQKVPYGSITKIESWPVDGNEAYSILALHLGVGGTSRYWLYFYPSQYVAGLKIKILGVQSLI
eukprot:XP_001693951.1 predicted protein [Chlamydomonas reinhardtii]